LGISVLVSWLVFSWGVVFGRACACGRCDGVKRSAYEYTIGVRGRGDVALAENSTDGSVGQRERDPGALILIKDGVCRLLSCLGFGRQQTMPLTVDRRSSAWPSCRVGTTRQFRALGLDSEVGARVSNWDGAAVGLRWCTAGAGGRRAIIHRDGIVRGRTPTYSTCMYQASSSQQPEMDMLRACAFAD
jgi:hypothetical protein